MIANIQNAINSRALPFPVVASQGAGNFVTLTVRIRCDGRESAESFSFPTPTDLVILDGFSAAMSRAIHAGCNAQHIGLEVF